MLLRFTDLQRQTRFPNVIIFIDFRRVISDINGCHSSKIELQFYIYKQMFIFMDDKKGERKSFEIQTSLPLTFQIFLGPSELGGMGLGRGVIAPQILSVSKTIFVKTPWIIKYSPARIFRPSKGPVFDDCGTVLTFPDLS